MSDAAGSRAVIYGAVGFGTAAFVSVQPTPAAQREWDEDRRARSYGAIQERIDEAALLVPLYAPRRFAVLRADLPPPVLDHDLYRIDAASIARASSVQQR